MGEREMHDAQLDEFKNRYFEPKMGDDGNVMKDASDNDVNTPKKIENTNVLVGDILPFRLLHLSNVKVEYTTQSSSQSSDPENNVRVTVEYTTDPGKSV